MKVRPFDPVLAMRARRKYDLLIEPMRACARECGYALAVHGSLARDIDLVAVPWVANAKAPEVLVGRLHDVIEQVNGFALIRHTDGGDAQERWREPEWKAFGRLAWSIHLGGGPYIDLSVMPRAGVSYPARLFDGDGEPEMVH